MNTYFLLASGILILLQCARAMDSKDNDTVLEMFPDVKQLQKLTLNKLYEQFYDMTTDQIDTFLQQCPSGLATDIQFVTTSKLQYKNFLAKFVESISEFALLNPKEKEDLKTWILTQIIPCLEKVLSSPTDRREQYTDDELMHFKEISDNLEDENISIFFYHTLNDFIGKIKSISYKNNSETFTTKLFKPFFLWILEEFKKKRLVLFFASSEEIINDITDTVSSSLNPAEVSDLALPPQKKDYISKINNVAGPTLKYTSLVGISIMLIRLLVAVQNLQNDVTALNHTIYNLSGL